MRGLSLATISGGVAFVLGWFVVPEGLRALTLLAIAGWIAGYLVGELIADAAPSPLWRAVIIFLTLVLTFVCCVSYLILVEQGLAGASIVIILGALLTGIFFGTALLVSVAGLRLDARWWGGSDGP
jgi:hypothetical protein